MPARLIPSTAAGPPAGTLIPVGRLAVTVTVVVPLSSDNADTGVLAIGERQGDAAVYHSNINRIRLLDSPATVAEPLIFTFSGVFSISVPSSRAVSLNTPDPLTSPEGIDTVNVLFVLSVQTSSVAVGHTDDATVAPLVSPAATVTVTSVSDANTEDEAPANLAVTSTS